MLAVTAGLMAGGDIAPVQEPVVVERNASGYYAGAGYSVKDLNSDYFDNFGDNFSDRGLVTLNGGYAYNDYVAAEARYVGDFDYYNAFLFGKLTAANESDFSPYLLLGLNTEDFDRYSAAVGVGVEYDFTAKFSGFVDYIGTDFSEREIYSDITTLGIKYNF